MVKVQITTAVELSAKQADSLERALEKKLAGQQLSFEYQVQPEVLGGIKVIVGSKEYDGTLQARLEQIHQHLTEQL